jgi:hypothetical protein
MKKVVLVLFLSLFLCVCSCSFTGSQNDTYSDQKQGFNEQTQASRPTLTPTAKPILTTPTTRPSPTAEPQNTSLESVQIGGIFSVPITLLYDPNEWAIGENDFDKILELKNIPDCTIYENIPMGLPEHYFEEVEQLEEKMGPYNLILTKYLREGEIYFAIFNFYEQDISIDSIIYEQGISIAVRSWGDDPTHCFDAAWKVIETSAENAFSPLD